MNAVEVSSLSKSYGGRLVLDLDRLEIAQREFFVLLGPSGSGKSTLLRILAGLLAPDGGEVRLDGRSAEGVAPHRRGIGYVFQGLALWPHLTVRGNLALGLAHEVPAAGERARRIAEAARDLGIDRFLDRRPARLSGGERQRVALARALVRRPKLLLLDEPFSDLDARLRRETARLVRRLHDAHAITTLLITHDRTDAHLLADRIGVLREGRLSACGRPDELHRSPGGVFAAEFLTDASILRGTARDGSVATALGTLALDGGREGPVRIAVRPDEVQLASDGIAGVVVACEFAGGPWRCRVAVGDEEVAALSDCAREPGSRVGLRPPATPRTPLLEDS